MSTDPSASNYFSEAQYEYDMTQNAIWGVEGNVPGDNVPTSSFGNAYQDDPLSEALYNYATQHPLDAKNAAQNGVTLENAQGKPMGASDTLTVDPKTHESEGFQVKGGDVTLPTSTNGYHVVNAQGQTVTTLEPGETYHVVFSPSTDPAKVNMMCPYLHVATADYYHSDDPASTGINGQKPWQNMVGLTTNTASIAINFKMGSESSSIASTKSSVQSSVKSSSAIKSSSVKSSSAVKSSSKKSSSSVKSSSVVSSSKKSSSSVKSSSVASSKKATATTSSETTKNSSSKATKTTSSVASAKKTSLSVSTKVATSSSNNTTSAKKGVVAGVVNHSSNSGKGTGHGQGKGEGHGMPQTGEAVATSLIAAGVVLLAAAGAITLRKRN